MRKRKVATGSKRSVLGACGLFVLLAAGVARAAIVVQEGFNYSPVAPINGTQTGGVGFATSSSWGSASASIVAGLKYSGYAAAGSNAFSVTSNVRIERALASSFGGSTFYVSMLINNYGVNDARFGVELRNGDGPCLGHVNNGWGLFAGQNGKGGVSNTNGSYQTWTGVTAPADSLTHLIVFKFDYTAQAIKLYVDPLPALGEPVPSATLATGGAWTIALNSDLWNAISAFRGGGANETLDEICVGTTWADVAPVDPFVTSTDSWWTNVLAGAGSSWGDSNNWVNTAGANVLPGPGHANLTVAGASYTALYDSVQPAISNLTVQNVVPYRTGLLISAPLTSLGGAAIRLMGGSSLTVTNGGVWNYVGTNRVTDNGESMLSIRNGGEMNISGGLIFFTNLLAASTSYGNSINVGYQSTGTLRVTSGRMEYLERGPASMTNDNRQLRIGSGVGGVGAMEISGGSVMLGKMGAVEALEVGSGSGSPIGSTKGTVVISGGELVFTNNPVWNLARVGWNYGEGVFIVTNTGYVNLKASGRDSRVQVGVSPYGKGLLRMTSGKMIVGDGLTAGYNNGYNGAVWATGVVEVAGGTLDAGSGFVIGYAENASGGGNGVGLASITGGRVAEGYWGVFIGRGRVGGVANGSLTITNGLLDITGSADPEATGTVAGNGAYSGLAIGAINPNEANASSQARGTLTLSGSGVITNAGVLVVGVNGGTGTVTQTGGKVVHVPSGGVAASKLTVLGYGYGASGVVGGGRGTYEMSGGSYYTPNMVFVGGVPTNLLSYSRAGCAGMLKVTGGSFTVTNNTLTVGGNGTGTLTIGSNGVCFAKDIVFTNNAASTLRCELGPAGLGTLTASGTLSIYPGAKLEVDSTAYQGGAVWVKLVDCATRTAAFAPENITVTGKGVVRQDRNEDIWLYIRRGTLIDVR